jgi:ATP-dependent RNA circularization protein (DNA/RNA ligase family)
MKKYHKIQTVYFRDPENSYKTLLEGTWAKPEFELLKDINWVCTEKIDGTNIRIMWNGENVRFGGKTDNAQIPTILIGVLQDTFTNEIMSEAFPDADNVCLYGEGFGKKIQKGGNYMPDRADFILFDVKIGNWWLTRLANEDIAEKLNIEVVPIIGIWKLEKAIEYVKQGFISTIADNKQYVAEGLIMKPTTELFNRKGERVIAKIKHKDFAK